MAKKSRFTVQAIIILNKQHVVPVQLLYLYSQKRENSHYASCDGMAGLSKKVKRFANQWSDSGGGAS